MLDRLDTPTSRTAWSKVSHAALKSNKAKRVVDCNLRHQPLNTRPNCMRAEEALKSENRDIYHKYSKSVIFIHNSLPLTNTLYAIMHVTFITRYAFTSTVSCLIGGSGSKKVDEKTLVVLVWWAFMNTYFIFPVIHFCNGCLGFMIYDKTQYKTMKF